MSNSLNQLFDDAQDEGLSMNAAGILVNNLNPVTMMGATGAAIDDLAGDEVTLFGVVIDATGSMSPYRTDVIAGYNDMLQALRDSKAADSILMSTILFNTSSTLRHGYLSLQDVPNLDQNSYNPDSATALYDATLDAFTGIVAYGQQLRNGGIRTKCVIVVISDGEDNASRHATEAGVRTVALDLQNQEIYQLAFVYFGNNGQVVAQQMGFPANNVFNTTASPSEIRRALGTVSKSVIRASQTTIGGQSGSFFS